MITGCTSVNNLITASDLQWSNYISSIQIMLIKHLSHSLLLCLSLLMVGCKCLDIGEDSTPPAVIMLVEYNNNGNGESITVGSTGAMQEIEADPGSVSILYTAFDTQGVVYLGLSGSITMHPTPVTIQQGTVVFPSIGSKNCPVNPLMGVQNLDEYNNGVLVLRATARNNSNQEARTDGISIRFLDWVIHINETKSIHLLT